MNPDYSKRDYLLPPGCKDLIDVLNLQGQKPGDATSLPLPSVLSPSVIIGELEVPERMAVGELAALLDVKPYYVVANLLEMGMFATVNQLIDFETISRVARKYGYLAKKKV